MTDDTLLHKDALDDLAERAALSHEANNAREDGLNYENIGVCTADLLAMARGYVDSVTHEVKSQGGGYVHAMIYQFVAGFDIGYHTRLEIESRTLAKADISDTYLDDRSSETGGDVGA